MATIENLFNANGEMMYPLTHTKAVVNDSGENVEQILEAGLELANQGYKFMGIATPNLVPITQPTPGSPKVYWEASIAGTYGNLGNLVVNDGETAYLMWNGATWEKKISNTIVNNLTTGGADKALSAEMGKELDRGVGKFDRCIKDLDGDVFFISDSRGNIVASVSKEGIMSSRFEIKDSKVVEGTGFHIVDRFGNIAFKIDNAGNVSFNKQESNVHNSMLKGKNVYSICDSLGQGNSGVYWQEIACKLLGAQFTYGNGLIHGGTKTIDASGLSGMDRARTLVTKYRNADAIFIENINDISAKHDGSIDDTPFMAKHNIVSSSIYSTKANAESSLAFEIGNTEAKVGTLLRIRYSNSSSFDISILGASNAAGTIRFTAGNNIISTPTIQEGSSIEEVGNAIASAEWTQYGYTASYSNGKVTISGETAFSLSYQDLGTGVPLNITTSSAVSYIGRCFVSYDINEWNDLDKWVDVEEISLYSAYKGLLEYVSSNFPNAIVFFVIMPRVWVSDSMKKRADDSLDWDGDVWNQKAEKLYRIQKECCEYMRVECVDVAHRCGINSYNALEYFPKANVHPTAKGYEFLGKQVARIIN